LDLLVYSIIGPGLLPLGPGRKTPNLEEDGIPLGLQRFKENLVIWGPYYYSQEQNFFSKKLFLERKRFGLLKPLGPIGRQLIILFWGPTPNTGIGGTPGKGIPAILAGPGKVIQIRDLWDTGTPPGPPTIVGLSH